MISKMGSNIRAIFIVAGFLALSSFFLYNSHLQNDVKCLDIVQPRLEEFSVTGNRRRPLPKAYVWNETNFQNIMQCKNCSNTFHPAESQQEPKVEDKQTKEEVKKRKIWISMALCFSKNTHMYNKKDYPYAQVTPLAIILWNHFFPEIPVLLYLIYDRFESKDRRKLYEEHLRQTNVEIRWMKEGDMDCVTKSQLIRMWAFQEPMIQEDDIIVTVDVNLFVMTPKILDPIFQYPDKKLWVFAWYETAFIAPGIGEPFNQNLMSAEKRVWRQIINADNKWDELKKVWVSERIEEIGLERVEHWTSKGLGSDDMWYYDQWITSYGILKQNFCTVPEISGLWRLPGLVNRGIYFPNFNDSEICWHGKNYRSCDIEMRIISGGCKWWHWRPKQTLEEHVKKFNEITENTYKLEFGNMFTNETYNRLHPPPTIDEIRRIYG